MNHITQKIAVACATALLTSSCIVVSSKDTYQTSGKAVSPQHISPTLGGKLYSSAWMQRSAEYKALCLQSFEIAKLRLNEALSKPHSKPLAIVTDIDETIVDNSPNSVHQALKGEDYTDESWDKWCDRAEAGALAGAVRFFNYADSKGVRIYYVTNRNERNRAGTIRNLQSAGFPQLNDENFLFRTKTSDKTERRESISKNYDIVLLLGDNLGDFEHAFDSSNEADRDQALKQFEREFGHRFIVLPNPNYGTWEKAMNGGYPPLKKKDAKLKTILKTY